MKNQIKILLVLILLFTFVLPVSAMQTADVAEKIVVVDDLDREVEISLPVESIVSLAPSLTEILCAIDLCDELVAVDIMSNYPADTDELEKVTNSDMSINLEAIVKLDPELVLITELTPVDQVKSLTDLGLTVFYLKNPTSLDELGDYFMKIGELTGHESETEALTKEIDDRIAAIDEKLADVEEKPLVFYEIDATDPAKPWTTSSGTFIDELITRAGGTNIAADLTGEWVQFSLEALIHSDPEVIVLADSNYGVTPESVETRPGWDELAAVQSDRVYPIDSDIASRPGPRMVDALEFLAAYFHPELFPAE